MPELHGAQLPSDGLHVAIRYDVPDQPSRDALVLTPDDVGALLLQRDVSSIFALVSVTPVVWTQFADGESTLQAIIAINTEVLERVEGPPASNDNAVPVFDGSTGKLLKESLVSIDHLGNITTGGTVDGVDVSNLALAVATLAVPSYVTLASTPTLMSERVLTAGPGIAITDGGAGGPVTIEATGAVGAPANAEYLVSTPSASLSAERVLTAGTNITLTPSAGALTIASTGAGAPIDAEYLVAATHAGLTAERVLTAGSGIAITPGAGTLTVASTVTPPTAPLGAPPDVAASSVTGTPGAYAASNHTHGHGNQAGGALHATVIAGGAAGFMAGVDKTKLDGIAAGATNTPAPPTAPASAPPNVGAASVTGTAGTYATATHTHGHGDQAGGTLHALVTTSTPGFASAADKVRIDALPSVGAAPLDAEYLVSTASTGLSAERVLTAGANITLTPSAGALTIASTATAGAPTTAQYLTLATDATLTSERVLTAGAGVALTDGGAGGALTIAQTTIFVNLGTSYTPVLADAGKWLGVLNAGATVLTIPNTSTVSFPAGTELYLSQQGVGKITLSPAAGVTFQLASGKTLTTNGLFAKVTLTHLAPNFWNVTGDLEQTPSYLTLAADTTLANERVLTAGTGISLVDGGAGGALTISNTASTSIAINAQTGTTYTLVLADAGKLVSLSNAAAIALTVPANATVAFPVGTTIVYAQADLGQVTATGAGGVTLNHPAMSTKTRARYSQVSLVKTATDAWLVGGDMAVV